MTKTCVTCQSSFEVLPEDRALLDKLSPTVAGEQFLLPDPKSCYDCRQRRRLTWYNRRRLYRRKCDFSGKDIISIISPDKPYTVYEHDHWFSGEWDPLNYGRDIDFSRPFFEQYADLLREVPMSSLNVIATHMSNSEFTNDVYHLKDCYLVFDGEQGRSCYYGETFAMTDDCMDFLTVINSQKCYECVNCENSHNLKFSQFSQNCSDSWFLRDCFGSRNCFGCVNLHQKEYHIFNEARTKEEYEAFMAEFESGNYQQFMAMKKKFEAFCKDQPLKSARVIQCENSSGDNLNGCKDSYHCFDSNNLRDCRYCTNMQMAANDCMDVHVWGKQLELAYNCIVVGDSVRELISCFFVAIGCSNVAYSSWCTRNCKNLFGCIGLQKKEYCILNKQYTKEEYESLLPRLIRHMQDTGEWGEFFPEQYSPFGYNETLAQEYFPSTKESVQSLGWKWSDYEVPVQADKTIPAVRLPDRIDDIPDDILNWAITCEASGKPFKLVPQELTFYRQHRLPVPRRHPDQRHLDRLAMKNPRYLWRRPCDQCEAEVQSSCAADRSEKVYCAECYRKLVY